MKGNTPEYIDIHAHVNFPDYDLDREEVIRRCQEEGVWMINVGTDAKTSVEIVELADKYEGMFAIVGQHPTSEENFDESLYRRLLANPKVVGIGECGLDFFHMPEDQEARALAYKRQEEVFRKQIELAIEFKKPIMIHARDSYMEILAILDEYLSRPGVHLTGNAHFFAGTKEEAQAFIDRGFTVSFTGVITFAKQYKELVEYVPLDKLMSETDCPFVAPIPHRGKRNEPAFVIEVAKKIAEIKGVELEVVKKAIIDNAFRLFKLS